MKGSSKFYLWGEERGGERSVRVGLVCFNFTWKLYYLVYNIQNHRRMGALNLVWCRNFYLFPFCWEQSFVNKDRGEIELRVRERERENYINPPLPSPPPTPPCPPWYDINCYVVWLLRLVHWLFQYFSVSDLWLR